MMMALTIPINNFKKHNNHHPITTPNLPPTNKTFIITSLIKTPPNVSHRHGSNSSTLRASLPRACGDSGGGAAAEGPTQLQSVLLDTRSSPSSRSSSGDDYVGLFVQMLGLESDSMDREQAVVALWKYSLGGKHCVDAVMKFEGSINLIVDLLKSESPSACEAASGLLRTISSIDIYRELVAQCGAIEEITSLLCRSLTADVNEQGIYALWNLSVGEKLGQKIANSKLLPLLVKFLEDEVIRVKEAAAGVLANLALDIHNHKLMVEAGVIPNMAKFLKSEAEESKLLRNEARKALLELCKDRYYKLHVIEEGLLLVPLVGASAYKSFKPSLYSWPSLPDGTEIKQSVKKPSRYGATELLIGLNIQEKEPKLEEAKVNAIVGRTQQQFLARIGAIESEKLQNDSASDGDFTILPYMDAVARLVLILELEDESAMARGAEFIADVAISEQLRVSFKEAGAIRHLERLLEHPSDVVRLGAIRALERLSVT